MSLKKRPAKATDFSVEEWTRYRYACPVEAALDAIGGRWKGVIVFHLLRGTLRFSDLQKLYPAITRRSLSLQLRQLERAGIVTRTVYPEVPPRVEYALTEFGHKLGPIVEAMEVWGIELLRRSK